MGPRRRANGERGGAAVEAAIVLPLLVLIVFGIIEFGRGYNANLTITHAAREGARVLALGGTEAEATQTVIDAAPELDGAQITVVTSGAPCVAGTPATVTVSYPVAYTIPLFDEGTWTLTEMGAMECVA